MIAKTIRVGVVVTCCIMLSFGLVSAQSTSSEGATAAPSNRLTQILVSARSSLDVIEASADNIGRMLRAAREGKDVVKVLCLDDKLGQMNVAARSAADRIVGLEAAVAAGNTERALHDEAVLQALTARANELGVEANQCIGEEKGVVGGSSLDVTIDPAIPAADTATPAATVVVSPPPLAASPTL